MKNPMESMQIFCKGLGIRSEAFNALAVILDMVRMSPVFLAIWKFAESVHDLEKLHLNLPGDCQLLRKDWLVFNTIWKQKHPELCKPDLKIEERSDEEWAEINLILTSLRNNETMTLYYVSRLYYDREELSPSSLPTREICETIYSSINRTGSGYLHFEVDFEDWEFPPMELGLFHEIATNKLVLQFVITSDLLDEDLTYRLLQLPTSMRTRLNGFTINSGGITYEIDLCYKVPADELMSLTERLSSFSLSILFLRA